VEVRRRFGGRKCPKTISQQGGAGKGGNITGGRAEGCATCCRSSTPTEVAKEHGFFCGERRIPKGYESKLGGVAAQMETAKEVEREV